MSAKRQIPFFNYPHLFNAHKEEIISRVSDVMSRGAFILQKELEEFENNAREFLGVKYFWGVADGTNALVISLRAAGIGPEDEVILPSHTYVATAASVHLVGATPVLAECGPDHMIDPESVRDKVRAKTKAIMPVHINGRTCAMEPLLEIANQYGLTVIEDAAQAFGSKYRDQAAGSFGLAGTISFYPAKLLGCFGDGGGVLTNDDNMAEKLFLWRDHGRNKDGSVVAWGTNCRLDNLQAAILNLKLKYFKQEIARRREIASQYQAALHDLEDITTPPAPDSSKEHFDVYQNYELRAGRRDELRSYLNDNGIRTIIQWAGKAVHQFDCLGLHADLPYTDQFFKECFMLPMNTSLSDEDVAYICDHVRGFYGR